MVSSRDQIPAVHFPERVGRYELLLPLGTGGMATVFLARSRGVGGFERDVALKLLHAHLRADEESKMHLLEEAKLAARIRHPNVVPVLEVDEDPYGLYLVMEYVEGETLSGLLQAARKAKETLPQRLVARILIDALAGLHAAHELRDESGKPLGLVHRDFSPQNILIGIDGTSRLADFGVAKAAGRAVRTKTGLTKGKVAYMSPEQARGQDVDRRCDVWAAGVVAWELVSGQRLYDKKDEVATILSVVTEEPPLLGTVVPNVNERLEESIASALTMEVEDRCPDAAELRRLLESAWNETCGIADAQEVGEFVVRVLSQKLEKRRARIAEVRELRTRMGEIVRPDDFIDVSEMTPEEDFDEAIYLPNEPTTVVDVPSSRRSGSGFPMPIRAVEEPIPASTTPAPFQGQGPATTIIRVKRTSRRPSMVVAVGVVIVAAAATVFLVTRGPVTGRAENPTAGVEGPAAARGVLAAHTDSVTFAAPQDPAKTALPKPASSAIPLDELKVPSESQKSGTPAVSTRSRGPQPVKSAETHKLALPRSFAPTKLADDPYGSN